MKKENNSQDEFIKNLTELYQREKESRCYFQLERDRLIKIRDAEKEKCEQLNEKLFEAYGRLTEFEKWHNEQVLNLNKKIKYLIAERDFRINDLKVKLDEQSKVNLELSILDRNNYLDGIRESLKKISEDKISLDEALRNLIWQNENKITNLQKDYSQTVASIQKACEERFKNERDNFLLITRNAIHEITELKDTQIAEIKKLKDKSNEDLRFYFKDLVQYLMSLIQSLNAKNSSFSRELMDIESKFQKSQKQLQILKKENEFLSKENKSLNSKSNLYIKNRKLFELTSAEYSSLRQKFNQLDLKYEALFQTHENLKKENIRLETYIQNLMVQLSQKFESVNLISIKKQLF